MYKYFHSRGLKNVADPRKMFCHVTEIEVEYTDESTFVARVSLIYFGSKYNCSLSFVPVHSELD